MRFRVIAARRSGLLAAVVLAFFANVGTTVAQSREERPIVLARQGAFEVGGKVISGDKGTLSCDHGHIEYQVPVKARAVAFHVA